MDEDELNIDIELEPTQLHPGLTTTRISEDGYVEVVDSDGCVARGTRQLTVEERRVLARALAKQRGEPLS